MLCLVFSSSFNLKESLATVGEKVCAEVSSCLCQHGFTPFSAEREAVLKGQIQAVASPDNSICKLIGRSGECSALPVGGTGAGGVQGSSSHLVSTVSTLSFQLADYVQGCCLLHEVTMFLIHLLFWKQTKPIVFQILEFKSFWRIILHPVTRSHCLPFLED